MQMRLSTGHRGQHEVADAQKRQTRNSLCRRIGAQNQQQYLNYVVVALEIMKQRVASQDRGNYS